MMFGIRVRFARLILHVIRWYFIGKEATRIRPGLNGEPEHTRGKIMGGSIMPPSVLLVWSAEGGGIDDSQQVSATQLFAVKGSWAFYD